MKEGLRAWRGGLTAGLLVLAALVLFAVPSTALAHTGHHENTTIQQFAAHHAADHDSMTATQVSAADDCTGHADTSGHGGGKGCCGSAACQPVPGTVAGPAPLSAPLVRMVERHAEPSPLLNGIAGSPALRPPSTSV